MGPLAGTKVIEFGGIGPAPFCGMLFADMGAEVVLVERRNEGTRSGGFVTGMGPQPIVHRGKKSVAIDLKKPAAVAAVRRLLAQADVLIEGFRPGVMEKLGLGPDECLAANGRLVYGRLSGWGQSGPLADCAGHDINYTALAGALFHGGHRDSPPSAPPTLVGDIGGGAMVLAVGLLAALLAARQSGQGQVVDAAISDGAALMTALLWGLRSQGLWQDRRQANLLDGGAPWYDCYECADGGYVSVGALEPRFYGELLRRCGLDEEPELEQQFDAAQWPAQKKRLAALFRSRTRQEWCDLLEGTDACFAPVLSLVEAAGHPHNRARDTFVTVGDVTQPAPAPRFSRTPSAVSGAPPGTGDHTESVLAGAGFTAEQVEELRAGGVI